MIFIISLTKGGREGETDERERRERETKKKLMKSQLAIAYATA